MANESSEHLNMPEGMDRFTATGKAYKAPTDQDKASAALTNTMGSDAGGGYAAVYHLPVKFTDDSILSIAVLPPGTSAPIETPKKKRFWSRRKADNSNFIMKEMSRREYLKHYAKDDAGQYCGTEAPAEDCILRGEDIQKYRPDHLGFRNEIDNAASPRDGVIR